MRRALPILLGLLCMTSPALAADPSPTVELGPGLPPSPSRLHVRQASSLDGAIEACVQQDMAAHDTPGAAVAVMLDGAVVYAGGFGEKRRGGGDPVDADTIFRIGSISKQMTAAALLRLVQEGRVRLQDPVTRFVPEFELERPGQTETITVWHLLTHTSGIPDTYNVSNLFTPMTLEEWVPHMAGLAPFAPPGAFWNYSNPNFSLAGLVVERAGGVPYEQAMETLWSEAGMTRTTLDPDQVMAWGDYSYGHYTAPIGGHEVVYAPDGYDSPVLAPAGGVFSTAPDLVRWADALITADGLSLRPAFLREMQSPQIWTHYYPGLDYGYGVFSEPFGDLRLNQHGGNINGWGAYLIWHRPRRFAVAVLANTTASLGAAAYCIAEAALAPGDTAPPDLTTDPAAWRPYAGRYRLVQIDGTVFDAEVRLEDSRLDITLRKPGDPSFVYTTGLVQAYLNTFLMDGNGDGELDLDLTFIPWRPAPGRFLWLRNRYLAGPRQGDARREAPGQGPASRPAPGPGHSARTELPQP